MLHFDNLSNITNLSKPYRKYNWSISYKQILTNFKEMMLGIWFLDQKIKISLIHIGCARTNGCTKTKRTRMAWFIETNGCRTNLCSNIGYQIWGKFFSYFHWLIFHEIDWVGTFIWIQALSDGCQESFPKWCYKKTFLYSNLKVLKIHTF